jgi:hypothetical protein
MKNNRLLRPDFIVALLAVVIGLSTMFVYIYQARIMSRQLHAAVWPFMEMLSAPGEHGLKLVVSNKGAGPAIVKTNRIFLDGVPYSESALDTVLFKLLGRPVSYFHTTVEGRVISSGESFDFLHFPKLKEVALLDSAFRKHDVRIETCYCSIYDDCWKVARSKTIECKSCD